MPKPFSEAERTRTRAAILAAARTEFSSSGYRKANIAAIAAAAGIGKGTIYLFFTSKASLFASVLAEVEREVRAELRGELDRPFDEPWQRVDFFLRALLTRMAHHPLLWIVVDPDEALPLFRDLGPAVEELDRADEEFFAELVTVWREAGWLRDVAPEVLAGTARGLFALSLHRDLIGAAYPAVVDLVIRALVQELVPA